MSDEWYPCTVDVYKGEGQVIVVPTIRHVGRFFIDSDQYVIVGQGCDVDEVGDAVSWAIEYVKNSPMSRITAKEFNSYSVWKDASKGCKNYKTFWKRYNMASVKLYENGEYKVYSSERNVVDGHAVYNGCIKELNMPGGSESKELGKAVLNVLAAAEEKYAQEGLGEQFPVKELQLLDGAGLTLTHPRDKRFEDIGDGGAAEIYQCYSYVAQEGVESSGEIYVGMAAELDCNLEEANIRECWEEMYGEAEYFELKQVNYGIYELRAEMRSKEVHRISYLLRQEEDLLLECTMNVNKPNKRKKLDERMTRLFEEFALSCKFI